MPQEEGATQQGVPAGGEVKAPAAEPVLSAREQAIAAIESTRMAAFEKESGVKLDRGTPAAGADPDADPDEAVAAAARAELEAKATAEAAAARATLDPSKQIAAQGGDELILDADTLAKAKVRVKIDGEEQLVPASKALAQYQKGGATDVRLADATRLQREAAEDRAKAAKELADASTRAAPSAEAATVKADVGKKIEEFANAIYLSEPERAATVFAEAVAAATAGSPSAAPAATPVVDTRAVVAEVRQQLNQESALTKLFADYPEISGDTDLKFLADRYVHANVTNGMSVPEAIAAAGEQLGEKFKLGKHADPLGRPLPTSGTPTTLAQKQAGKQKLDEPTASAARAAESPLQEESASDLIKQIAASRPGAAQF